MRRHEARPNVIRQLRKSLPMSMQIKARGGLSVFFGDVFLSFNSFSDKQSRQQTPKELEQQRKILFYDDICVLALFAFASLKRINFHFLGLAKQRNFSQAKQMHKARRKLQLCVYELDSRETREIFFFIIFTQFVQCAVESSLCCRIFSVFIGW